MHNQNILVIKHGSLGDWIQATGAFKLIRAQYPEFKIIMLTHPHYLPLAKACNWFNEVWTDHRLPLYKLASNFAVIAKLRSHNYNHVYDLQCSNRTNIYHFFTKDKVRNWYGRAKGCSHYVPFIDDSHSIELAYNIIKASGINNLPVPDVSWLKTNKFISKIKSMGCFVLFIPGSSAKHAHYKRWSAEGYAETINWLTRRKVKSVLIGTQIDKQIIEDIIERCSEPPINLINQAAFAEIAELSRAAHIVVGGDTGPMHIAAATKTHSLVLFSNGSNPDRSKPWGSNVHILRKNSLGGLSSHEVLTRITKLLRA